MAVEVGEEVGLLEWMQSMMPIILFSSFETVLVVDEHVSVILLVLVNDDIFSVLKVESPFPW